ncbi:unnamed protein product [Knipowitschia caucasica]
MEQDVSVAPDQDHGHQEYENHESSQYPTFVKTLGGGHVAYPYPDNWDYLGVTTEPSPGLTHAETPPLGTGAVTSGGVVLITGLCGLITVLVLSVLLLLWLKYRNTGSYRTNEDPEPDPEEDQEEQEEEEEQEQEEEDQDEEVEQEEELEEEQEETTAEGTQEQLS